MQENNAIILGIFGCFEQCLHLRKKTGLKTFTHKYVCHLGNIAPFLKSLHIYYIFIVLKQQFLSYYILIFFK
jgi:hypothetical protein